MAKPKRKFKVYKVGKGTGCYASSKTYLGDTWAVSEAQACNNVRHRTGGGYAVTIHGDSLEQGDIVFYYEAIAI